MNNKAINFMIFVLGVAVGSVITRQYVEKITEQIAQEEIDSVKVFYKRIAEITRTRRSPNKRRTTPKGKTRSIVNTQPVCVNGAILTIQYD